MFELTTEILSRIQFAFTITFHGVFPTLNIGLGLFLVYWEYLFLKTGTEMYRKLCQFWSKIFALSFAMGVVSGVVLSYEIGANFSGLTKVGGNILGPLIMLETMSAFFLEAGFLGIMLFGWKRVSPKVHFFATCMVALGTVISLLWIMSANSFMHTPAGYYVENGQLIASSWVEAVLNPSFLLRATHMLLASVLSTCFVIMGISSYYFLKKRDVVYASRSFMPALYVALALAFLQVVVGDLVGLKMYEYQPIKTAAIEANWQTQNGAPLVLFGWPDASQEVTHFELSIPKLGSFINTHDWDGELMGLDQVTKEDRPPVAAIFWSFRVMVGVGLLFILLSVLGFFASRKEKVVKHPLLLKAFMAAIPLGFVATTAGWFVSELGRQPWVVYGLLRISDAVSPLAPEEVMFSLSLIFILYMGFLITYFIFILRVIQKGPDSNEKAPGMGYMVEALSDEDEK